MNREGERVARKQAPLCPRWTTGASISSFVPSARGLGSSRACWVGLRCFIPILPLSADFLEDGGVLTASLKWTRRNLHPWLPAHSLPSSLLLNPTAGAAHRRACLNKGLLQLWCGSWSRWKTQRWGRYKQMQFWEYLHLYWERVYISAVSRLTELFVLDLVTVGRGILLVVGLFCYK